MNIYLIYEESSNHSVQNDITKKFGSDKCFPIADGLFFVKTDSALNEVMDVAGFNEEEERTGFIVETASMNGWYNVSLWNWQKK